MSKISSNTVGVNLAYSTDDKLFELGSTVNVEGGTAVYVQASANISANATAIAVNTTDWTATGTGGAYAGPAKAVPSGEYFWAVKAL